MMSQLKSKIAIAGLGHIGRSIYYSIDDIYKSSVLIYNLDNRHNPIEKSNKKEIEAIDFIFICLPTLIINNKIDCTVLYTAFEKLISLQYKGIVIIKSTILPDYLLKYIDKLNIVVNPDLSNEQSSIEDFKNQKYIVLGGNIEDTNKVELLYKSNFNLIVKKFEHVDIQTACYFKYSINIKNALDILYWNLIHDVSKENESKIIKMMNNIPSSKLNDIYKDGYRGFGGSYLPKDIEALFGETDHIFLKNILEYNSKLINEN